MKEIKVFLASSEELKYDRLAFSDLIRKLDNIYEKRGIRIRLFQWEDFDAAYNDKRKQDEYNEYIKQSDLFLALFRTKAGQFTVEEFELARNEHREKGLPKPHVYCRDLEQGETEDKTLSEFKQKLFDEMGHFFARYKNEDGLNLHFVMQLQLLENSRLEQVETDGNLITFCGEPIAKTDNIDFFAKNKDFIRMREDLKDLNADIEDLRLRQASAPEDEKLKNRIQEKLNKRNALQEEFEHYRKQILRIERQIIELQGQEINEAVKRAMEAFAEGEVNKADIILSEATQGVAQRREEYIEHKKTGEQMRKNLLADIDALLLKAETVLSNTEKTIEERISEALNAYREADKTAQEIDCPAEKYIELLNKYGIFLYKYAYYKESIEVNLRFIRLSEQTNGQNEITATSYNNIGIVYANLGEYGKALEYYFKALEITKDVLGEKHTDTANSYNNIGVVYANLGEYDKALEFFNKALEIQKDVLGENHPDTAVSYNNIGSVYANLGEYDKALEYLNKALEIRKEVLGENHTDTANSYNNIGSVYANLGEYDKALEYHNKALEIRKEVLGENHPDTANSCNNIGSAYVNLGDYDKALEYYIKALEIFKEVLGENHPNTAMSYIGIGIVYDDLGDYNKALESHNKALEITKEVLGEKHPDTAMSYINIGAVYANLGDYDKALEYFIKALEIQKEVLGEKHPDTAMSYNNIGVVYKNLGDYDKALELYNKALEIRKEVLGESHPYTQTAIENIEIAKQNLEESQGKREE
ncbi:MAG: tetratricopeptide repeat protein [Bacteroidales bacterium]|nr:tetratricopeptide repeat protein [Bacteroidales bacterium]